MKAKAATLLLALTAGGAGLLAFGCRSPKATSQQSGPAYYCPMHPHYRSDKPGNCPICSMKLVPLEGSPSPSVADKAVEVPSASSSTRVRITPERQQQMGVKVATVTAMPASVEIRAVGRVAYDETRIAHVHTKVNGWIEDVFVGFVGAAVKKGQPLFTLYSPDLVASQEEYLLALKAERELGESAVTRAAEGSRSLREAARRRLELWDLTPEQIAALDQTGRVSKTLTIHSPVSGVVTEREAYHHGRTVSPEMDLYTIVDLSRVWVLAEVYEYELPQVRVGQTAEAQLPYEADEKPLTGKVAFIAPFLDPKTRTVQVRLEFPNQGLALKPEAFVNVLLRRDLGRRLVIPKDALMDTGRAQYVFVDKGEGYFEPREVRLGPEVSAGRVVSQGLAEGERIVTTANFILDSESRLKGAFDAMGRPATQPTAEAPSGAAPALSIELATDPSPPKAGRNTLRVTARDARGEPVVGADVSVRLFMPPMPGMAPMDLRLSLKAGAPGEYAGEIAIPAAGSWATTVTVRRGGQVVGSAEKTLTAR